MQNHHHHHQAERADGLPLSTRNNLWYWNIYRVSISVFNSTTSFVMKTIIPEGTDAKISTHTKQNKTIITKKKGNQNIQNGRKKKEGNRL